MNLLLAITFLIHTNIHAVEEKEKSSSVEKNTHMKEVKHPIQWVCDGEVYPEFQSDKDGSNICYEILIEYKDGSKVKFPQEKEKTYDNYRLVVSNPNFLIFRRTYHESGKSYVVDLNNKNKIFEAGLKGEPIYSPNKKSFFIYEDQSPETCSRLDIYQLEPTLKHQLYIDQDHECSSKCITAGQCFETKNPKKEGMLEVKWVDDNTISALLCQSPDTKGISNCEPIVLKYDKNGWSGPGLIPRGISGQSFSKE